MGFANFTDLRITISAVYCALSFYAPSVVAAESEKFEVGSPIPMAGCFDSSGLISSCGPPSVRTMILVPDIRFVDSVAGSNFTAVLIVRDHLGNQLTLSLPVLATIKMGTGSMNATLSGGSTVMQNGLAFFSTLSIDQAGIGYVLQFLCADLVAESNPFNIAPGFAHRIQVEKYVGEVPINTPQQIEVSVLDTGGGHAQDSFLCRSISVSLESFPRGSQLIGTRSALVFSGAANFTNIAFSMSGIYILRFTCLASNDIFCLTSSGIKVNPFGNIGMKTLTLLQSPGFPVP